MDCQIFQRNLENILEDIWAAWDQGRDGSTPEDMFRESFPEAMVQHVAGCAECRTRLNIAKSLIDARNSKPEVPPRLIERTMDLLQGKSMRSGIAFGRWLPALSAAAVLIVVLVFGRIWIRPEETTVLVKFQLEAPEASRVYVVGDWNGWNPAADSLEDEDGDGHWEAEIFLTPGNEYRYQFFIDDRKWVADPRAPLSVHDEFGGFNSILQL